MKKLLVFIFLAVMGICVAVSATAKTDGIVRIHIRASSDSQEDQDIKFKVRDGINEYLAPKLKTAKTKKEAEAIITESLTDIRRIGEEIANCEVSAELKEEEFPQKTYGNKTYPAGKYTALIVSVGEGKGRNWWCVAFPPMCYTTEKSEKGEKREYRSLIYDLLERIGLI